MRQMFVAGNWKMHGSKADIKSLVTGLNAMSDRAGNAKVAICPPALYVDYVNRSLSASNIELGVQNIAEEPVQGAYTGEISAGMVKDLGCQYVILGHSERRAIYKETDAEIANKVDTAIRSGLTPILCVGETLEEREAGQLEEVISTQINAVVAKVGINAFKNVVIAYEPVWAIGTGKTATAEQAQEVHAFIRNLLAAYDEGVASGIIIQYGGSVKPDNAKELFSQPDIDGGLIGGASLVAEDFMAICEAAGE
jgi:triosephosphate isomerase